MDLGLNDLHMVLSAQARSLKLFDVHGHDVFACETRNRTTANGQYGHDGNCPPGEFLLGLPSPRGSVPFGAWFIPILDYDENHAMAEHGRAGIGLHGGGTGLERPFAPRQGWQVTHGCWRLQNVDLAALVAHLHTMHVDAGRCYVTVTPGLPGAGEQVDDYAPLPAGGLFPDE